jgi:hypothetical protein
MPQDTENRSEHPSASAETSGSPRLPYEPPRLRYLGAVREVTLGSLGGFSDSLGGFKATRA